MKKEVVRIYNKIVIWVSLFLTISLFVLYLGILREFFNIGYSILSNISFFVYYGLLIYSIIMLVYVFAKRKREEYLFAFMVPFLLTIGFVVGTILRFFVRYSASAPPAGFEYQIAITILFLYSLYNFWRKNKAAS